MPYLHINDIDISYIESGEGEPLVLIHGLGSSKRDWELQIPFFSQWYRVIAFDLRGHGKTTVIPGPYSISMFAADTAALLESLNASPAHIVGISLGGIIAFQLYFEFPQTVKSLTIANSYPEIVLNKLKDNLEFWRRMILLRISGMRTLAKVQSRRLFPRPDQKMIRDIARQRIAENSTRVYIDTIKAMKGWSVVDYLPEIYRPTMIIAADQDYVLPEQKRKHVSLIPEAEFVILENSRHASPVDQPEVFNKIVLDFLAKHSNLNNANTSVE